MSVYTDIAFTNQVTGGITAMKLNKLRDDLSAAIGSIGGYYTDTWQWTTNTANASGSGQVGINTAGWSAATFLNISEYSASGADKTVQMDKVIASGNAVLVKDAANSANYAEYTFTGAGVDMGTWRQYPVSTVKFGGVPPKNNGNTTLTIYVQGATGGGGTGTGDMTKAIYDTNSDNIVDKAAVLSTTGAIHQFWKNGNVWGQPDWADLSGKPTTFPPDSTAMLKSVYDTNADSIVDHAALADSAPWTGITGKPSTFPPDSTAMLKSVYDTNANNKVDASESADSAPWTGITGKPTSFTPSAHASTHLDNGSDPVPVVTTSRTGLAPVLSGNAATYLDGTGTFSAVSGSVNPGTWTTLSLGTGWTTPTQAQYRVEVNGAVSTVYFRGMIQAAYSALGTIAFTAPAGARPSMTRSVVLGGAQNTGTATDVASYIASVASTGVCTIYALTAGPFVWYDPAQVQQVYLDGLSYSL